MIASSSEILTIPQSQDLLTARIKEVAANISRLSQIGDSSIFGDSGHEVSSQIINFANLVEKNSRPKTVLVPLDENDQIIFSSEKPPHRFFYCTNKTPKLDYRFGFKNPERIDEDFITINQPLRLDQLASKADIRL